MDKCDKAIMWGNILRYKTIPDLILSMFMSNIFPRILKTTLFDIICYWRKAIKVPMDIFLFMK